MVQAPVSESKKTTDTGRTTAPLETKRELHPHSGGFRSPRGNTTSAFPAQPGTSQHLQQASRLQRTIGNQAMLRSLSQVGPRIQTKLTVNQPGDRYEQEADRMADQVMRMSLPGQAVASANANASSQSIQRKCSCGGSCSDCSQGHEEKQLHMKSEGIGHSTPISAPPAVCEVLRSPGQPLDHVTRAFMEPRFARDFSDVRVHAGAAAEQSARNLNAQAYTVGNNIVFAAGRQSFQTSEGRSLLAHELTHVIQQSGARPSIQRAPATKASGMWAEETRETDILLPECKYDPGEKKKSYAVNGILDLDVAFANYYGLQQPDFDAILIADFGVDSAELKTSTLAELRNHSWIYNLERSKDQLEIIGYSDCAGWESGNATLRTMRAQVISRLLPKAQTHIKFAGAAPFSKYVTENSTIKGRALNRSVLIRRPQPPAAPQPATPKPPATKSPAPPVCKRLPNSNGGKRCKFFVYDSTLDDWLGRLWKVAVHGDAAPRLATYVIPSGDNMEELFGTLLNTYAEKDCDCTDEVQFWGHANDGGLGVSISHAQGGTDGLRTRDLSIPGIEQFGDDRSQPGYQEWESKLSTFQRRLMLVRRTICDSDSTIYYRACEVFRGQYGQEFAKASSQFWRCDVAGHTKNIGLTQPGKHTLSACQEPDWSVTEGADEENKKGKGERWNEIKPK